MSTLFSQLYPKKKDRGGRGGCKKNAYNSLLDLKKPELVKLCVDYSVKKDGNIPELRERISKAMTTSNAVIDDLADEIVDLLADSHPGHSPISSLYSTRFNMVDQFDRDFYSCGPQQYKGSVFGKWMLDIIFLVKLNAFAKFTLDSDIMDVGRRPLSFSAFTINLSHQLGTMKEFPERDS